jgi:Flp pilus assembly pilin Flp
MKFVFKVKSFLHGESGAVTVEWVALFASFIGLTVLALSTIETTASDVTSGTTIKMNTVASGG